MGILQNQKHETFVQAIMQGKSQRQAYIIAYPNAAKWKPGTIDPKASNLFNEDKVQARYQELQKIALSKAIMSREERMLTLSDIALDPTMPPKSRMQAIDILNKMDGDYVKKVEATITRPVDTVAHEIEAILDE